MEMEVDLSHAQINILFLEFWGILDKINKTENFNFSDFVDLYEVAIS